ncbi:Ig-like domain-containing protein, partial [Chloroflexota bacterium]
MRLTRKTRVTLISLLVGLTISLFLTPEFSSPKPVYADSLPTNVACPTTNTGGMFDVTVSGTSNLTLTGFAIRFPLTVTESHDVEIYYKAGTYVGVENNPAAWTHLGTYSANNAAITPTDHINMLPGETYGFYIYLAQYQAYLCLTPGSNTYSDSNITINTGNATYWFPWGTILPDYTWNGSVRYEVGPEAKDDTYFFSGAAVNSNVMSNDFVQVPPDSLTSFGVGSESPTARAAGSTYTGTEGTLTVNSDGSFTYTPDGAYNSPFFFTYRLSDDAGHTSDATVRVDIYRNGQINIQKHTNGQDADNPPGPTISIGAPVNWEYIVTNVGGTVVYDIVVTDNQPGVVINCPADILAVGASMTCTASDTVQAGPYSNTGTATGRWASGVTSFPTTDSDDSHYYGEGPPVAYDNSYTTNEKTALNVTASGVLGNDTDPNNDTLGAVLDSDVGHGTLTLNGDGSFNYTPADDWCGTSTNADSFTYQARDETSSSNSATVTLDVTCINPQVTTTSPTDAATNVAV